MSRLSWRAARFWTLRHTCHENLSPKTECCSASCHLLFGLVHSPASFFLTALFTHAYAKRPRGRFVPSRIFTAAAHVPKCISHANVRFCIQSKISLHRHGISFKLSRGKRSTKNVWQWIYAKKSRSRCCHKIEFRNTRTAQVLQVPFFFLDFSVVIHSVVISLRQSYEWTICILFIFIVNAELEKKFIERIDCE